MSNLLHRTRTRTRARCGLLIAPLLVLWPRISAAQAAIAIDGDPPIRSELAAKMLALGFVLDEKAPSRASIAANGGALDVHATDETGRSAARRLSDLDAAAAWIESWVRSDLVAPLLRQSAPITATPPVEARAAPPVGRKPIQPIEVDSAARAIELEVPRATQERARCSSAQLGGRAEGAVGSDGDLWYGGAVGAATRLLKTPLCIGLDGRFSATQLAKVFEARGRRMLGEVLLDASWPFALGPLSLQPNLGAGIGWQRTWRAEEFSKTTFGPRIELGIDAALEIAAGTALELMLAFDLAPTAHREKFYPYGKADPSDVESVAKIEATAIAGEPWFLVRLGLGVRYHFGGAP